MGKISSLVPQNAAQQKDTLAKNLDVLSKIRAYAIGVTQTNLQTISDPPPVWYNTLSTNLSLAQTHAAVWTTTLEPNITSTIPQAVANLGSRFTTGTNAILQILKASNNNPTAAQVTQMQTELTWITRHLNEEMATITTLKGTFTTFQTNANTDLTALTTGNNSIQKAILADDTDINNLQADMAVQTANINADNAAITAAAIAGGVGLFVGVAMIGLGAASTGPAAPFVIAIGALIMVGSIVEMAAVIAVYEGKLAAAQNQLNQDTANLANEQQQVASLTIMNNSITSLVNLNQGMAQSLTDIANWWALISTQLGTVNQDISDASGDMTASDWSDFGLDIQQAQLDWTSFVGFATQWQVTATTLQSKVIVAGQLASVAA